MPRATEAKAAIEVERLELIHGEQKKLRKRLTKELKVKKAGPHLPGEQQMKQNMAVLLKVGVPNISFLEIANRLGETKGTVKGWFRDDPYVKEYYDWVLTNLKDGALELMKTYSLEAVETLVILMRFGSEKYMFESAREILDRVGVPKVERREVEHTDIKAHSWVDRDQLVSEIRALNPEQQEQAVEALEKFEELLNGNLQNTNGKNPSEDGEEEEDGNALDPIARADNDDTDEEDEDED